MSRYITFYTSTGTSKFVTLTTGAVSTSTAISARRITMLTGAQPHFIALGTSTVVATTSGAIVPANSILDINVITGTHLAVVTGGTASQITIVDAD